MQRPLAHEVADLDGPDGLWRANPALHATRSLRFHATDNDLVVACSKCTPEREIVILTVVNLDPHHTHRAWIDLELEYFL